MPEDVRAAAGSSNLYSVPIQQQVAALDPQLAVFSVYTMQQIVGNSTASQSFSSTLVLAFAALSLLLAAIGLYGVLSYLVSQRITGIGIRIALGAQRSEVLRLVSFDGLRPVFAGLAIGLAGGAVAATFIHSLRNQPAGSAGAGERGWLPVAHRARRVRITRTARIED